MYPNRNHAGHRTAALAALMLAGSLSLAACGEEIATDDAQQVEASTPAPDATRFEPGGPGRPAQLFRAGGAALLHPPMLRQTADS